MPAPKISAFAAVVVTAPLFGAVLVPLFDEVPSTGFELAIPAYSVMRTSADGTAALKATVTVLLAAALMLLA
jgi:hypothetical protein